MAFIFGINLASSEVQTFFPGRLESILNNSSNESKSITLKNQNL